MPIFIFEMNIFWIANKLIARTDASFGPKHDMCSIWSRTSCVMRPRTKASISLAYIHQVSHFHHGLRTRGFPDSTKSDFSDWSAYIHHKSVSKSCMEVPCKRKNFSSMTLCVHPKLHVFSLSSSLASHPWLCGQSRISSILDNYRHAFFCIILTKKLCFVSFIWSSQTNTKSLVLKDFE